MTNSVTAVAFYKKIDYCFDSCLQLCELFALIMSIGHMCNVLGHNTY